MCQKPGIRETSIEGCFWASRAFTQEKQHISPKRLTGLSNYFVSLDYSSLELIFVLPFLGKLLQDFESLLRVFESRMCCFLSASQVRYLQSTARKGAKGLIQLAPFLLQPN